MGKDVQIFQKNSMDIIFHVKTPSGTDFNLDGISDVRFGISRSPRQDAFLVFSLGEKIVISDVEKGIITVQLSPDDTDLTGHMVYELTIAFGEDVYTAATGDIDFLPSILAE